MDDFVANEFDGHYYLVGQQGETEEDLTYRHVDIRQADSVAFRLNGVTDYGTNGIRISNTLRMNYWLLGTIAGDKAVTMEQARKISYLRVLALSKGWGDIGNRPAEHNVMYNDVKIVDDAKEYNVPSAYAAQGGPDPVDRGHAHAIPNFAADAVWRIEARTKLMNVVCIVAYFMRSRGHHWLEDMDERYVAVWRKSLYDEDNIGLVWALVAHHALHFIYPDILDQVWVNAVDRARCAGTLIKRVNCYPAGVAALGAVSSGASDISIVFPAIRNLVPEAFEELDRCESLVQAHRWAGSINRRYYAAPNVVVDEKKIGSLAAVILAAYEGVASSAPLKNSKALQRVAGNAKLTGSLIAQMIQKAVTDERMVDPLFIEAAETP
jgi:hypothetical protein